MAHRIYRTEGIILRAIPAGEADRFFYMFTRECGVVGARAQGVRKTESKLRHGLAPFSHTRADLVRGKQVWRVVGAEHSPLFRGILKDARKRPVYLRGLEVLFRLCPPAEPHEELFVECVRAFSFLESAVLSAEESRRFELSFTATVLCALGYWGDGMPEKRLVPQGEWTQDFLLSVTDDAYRAGVREATRALSVSQL